MSADTKAVATPARTIMKRATRTAAAGWPRTSTVPLRTTMTAPIAPTPDLTARFADRF